MRLLLALIASIVAATASDAHFTMLLPESQSAKKGEPVTIVYQWGHPFEHQLFDASPPDRVEMITPHGTTQLVTKSLKKISVLGEGKGVAAYQLRFTPEQRGDYTFIVRTPPIWMPEDREFLQDAAKVVVHVQAQKGWDALDRDAFQIVPLTRPYGIAAGMVFRAQVLRPAGFGDPRGTKRMPEAGLTVFTERYHPEPPKTLPPDELITFTSKTDPSGTVTTSLPSGGWWCIAAQRDAGVRQYEGKDYPVRERVILWVYASEAAK